MNRAKKNILLEAKNTIASFFIHHPLFFISLYFFWGIACYHNIFLLTLGALSLIFVLSKQKIFAVAIFACGLIYSFMTFSPAPNHPVTGKGSLKITKIASSRYGKRYQGILSPFSSGTKKYPKIFCSFYSPKIIDPHYLYQIQGTLLPKHWGYQLKPVTIKAQKKIFNLCGWRYQMKKKVRQYIFHNIPFSDGAHLFNALLTGNMENSFLRYQFHRIGQQHILAISGFHFSMLIFLSSFILRRFFSLPRTLTILLPIVTLFLLYIGPLPSVIRSWIMVTLLYIGQLLGRKSSPLNLWGGALLLSLIYCPEFIHNKGFQLSFLSVLGILLYFPLWENIFSRFFIKRTVLMQNFPKNIFFMLSNYFRIAFSLFFSVMTLVFPLLLLYFHKISLLGLIYNLFFPLCITGMILLFAGSAFLHLFFPQWIFFLCSHWSHFVAALATHPPIFLERYFRVSSFSPIIVSTYLFVMIAIGIYKFMHRQKSLQETLCFL